MSSFYCSHGIIHCVDSPEKNEIVKRKRQHIMNSACSLEFHSYIPLDYWDHCALHAIHLINLTRTSVLNNKTPYEMLYNKPPPHSHLKVFG
jgi:hypothetical protein